MEDDQRGTPVSGVVGLEETLESRVSRYEVRSSLILFPRLRPTVRASGCKSLPSQVPHPPLSILANQLRTSCVHDYKTKENILVNPVDQSVAP